MADNVQVSSFQFNLFEEIVWLLVIKYVHVQFVLTNI